MTQIANPTIALFSSIKQRIMARKTDKFVELATLQEHSEDVSRPVLSTLMRLGFITCVPLCESGTRIYLLSAGKEHVNSSVMDIKTTVIAESLGLRSIYSKTPGAKAIKDIAAEAGELAGTIAAENILEQDHVVLESVQNCANPFDQTIGTNYNEWNQAWMAGWNKGYEAARQTLAIASDCVGETLDHPWNKPKEEEKPIEEFNDSEVFQWAWGDEEAEKNRPLSVAETNAFFDGAVVQEGFFGDLVKTAAKNFIADQIRNASDSPIGAAIAGGLADKFQSKFSVEKLNPYPLPSGLRTAIESAVGDVRMTDDKDAESKVLNAIIGKKVSTGSKAFAISGNNTIVIRVDGKKAENLLKIEARKFAKEAMAKQTRANEQLSKSVIANLTHMLDLIKSDIKTKLTSIDKLNDKVAIDKIIKSRLGSNYDSSPRLAWILKRVNPFIEEQKTALKNGKTSDSNTNQSANAASNASADKAEVAGKINKASIKVDQQSRSFDLDNLLVIAEGMILQEAADPATDNFIDIGITGCIETSEEKTGKIAKAKLFVYILPPENKDNSYPSIVNQAAGGGSIQIDGSPVDADTIGKEGSWIKTAPADLKELKPIPALDKAIATDFSFFAKSIKNFIKNPTQPAKK